MTSTDIQPNVVKPDLADPADLDDALRDLRLMSPERQVAAINQLAGAWAGEAPVTALEQSKRLPEDLRRLFRAAVAAEWVRLDLDAFLNYAEIDDLVHDLEAALRSAMHFFPKLPTRTLSHG